jgi:hypothetical protein
LEDPLNLGFRERFEEHDGALTAVESSATQFADKLMQSGLFQNQVTDSLERYQTTARGKPQYPDLDSMRESLPRAVVENLVNRAEVLPHHYGTHKFWEDHRSVFEPYHKDPSFQAVRQAASTLKDVSTRLLLDLGNHRQRLCRTYDIPAAPILEE